VEVETTHPADAPSGLRVLLVEDPPEDAALVTAVLDDTWGDALTLTRVAGLPAAETSLAGAAYDCVLLDSPAPPAVAADALARLGARARGAALVLLTADGVGPPPPAADDVLVRGRADGETIGRALIQAAEHRRMEADLAEARALGRLGTWTLDAATGEVSWSEDLTRLTGVTTRSGDVELDIPDLIHPEDRDLSRRMTERLLAGGERVEHDLRTVGPDGVVHHFHTVGEPVRDADGTVVGARGLAQEVTEQRRTEAALRRSEARLLEAQALAHIGSFERSLDGGERIWTPEVFRILGLDPAEGPRDGDAIGRLVHPDDRQAYDDWLARVRRFPEPGPVAFRIVRPDGGERKVQVRLRIERDDGGRAELVAGTIQDVTPA
jgi:PAS domain S-box-containing protein